MAEPGAVQAGQSPTSSAGAQTKADDDADDSSDQPTKQELGATAEESLVERGRAFTQRVLLAGDAVVKALSAVAGFAVAKFGANRLGQGDYAGWRWLWALLSVAGFAAGIAIAVTNVYSAYRGSRVSHGWLLSSKGKTVRDILDQTPYLFGGSGSAEGLKTQLDALIKAQHDDPIAFLTSPLSLADRKRLQILLEARAQALDEALAENTKRGSFITWMAVGAVVASVSAATFIYTTNQAARREEYALHERARNEARQDHQLARQEAREDRNDSMRATGTLLPHTPAAVRLRLPEDGEGPTLRASMSLDGKLSCDPSLITATLVAIESPPPPLDPGRVMRAYSPSVDGCRSAELWLHPSWVALEKPSTGDISD